jgi:hypothetical protein
MKALKIFIGSLAIVSMMMAAGCKKDKVEEATVNFRLTDAPANYDALFIDVQGIEVQTSTNGWVTLNSSLGVVDLLTLVNGKDTLIAGGQFSGRVSQVRLILGSNNSIVVNGTSYPLDVPSGEQSGLKINLQQDLQAGEVYEWTIDFDAAKSIVQTGAGDYKLKPVLRAFATDIMTGNTVVTGNIYGTVSPIAFASVCAISASNDTMCSMTSLTGGFMIQGLDPGTYTVVVTPTGLLNAKVVSNVTVTASQSTNIGIVVL